VTVTAGTTTWLVRVAVTVTYCTCVTSGRRCVCCCICITRCVTTTVVRSVRVEVTVLTTVRCTTLVL